MSSSPSAAALRERERFEDAIYAEHFLRAVKVDPKRQFWDLSAQKERADLFKRDGESYADEAISAMWFGWQKCTAQNSIVECAPAAENAPVEPAEPVGWRQRHFMPAGDGSGFTPWYYSTTKPTKQGEYHYVEPLYAEPPQAPALPLGDPPAEPVSDPELTDDAVLALWQETCADTDHAVHPHSIIRFFDATRAGRLPKSGAEPVSARLSSPTYCISGPPSQSPIPDGWLDDYITCCAKLKPYEMPGVYFVQGIRFAEAHYRLAPSPAEGTEPLGDPVRDALAEQVAFEKWMEQQDDQADLETYDLAGKMAGYIDEVVDGYWSGWMGRAALGDSVVRPSEPSVHPAVTNSTIEQGASNAAGAEAPPSATDYAAKFGCVCDGAGECFACFQRRGQ